MTTQQGPTVKAMFAALGLLGGIGCGGAPESADQVAERQTAANPLETSADGGVDAGPPVPPQQPLSCDIESHQGLIRGARVSSCDGRFTLTLQTGGDLVLSSSGVPMWDAHTSGTGDEVAVMQDDGNFVVYSNTGAPLFSTGTAGHPGAFVGLQDDGNMVVYGGGKLLWATNTGGIANAPRACGAITPGEGLAPGEAVLSCDGRFRLVQQGDGNLVLYEGTSALWASGTSGRGGRTAVVQFDGNFVVYAQGNRPLWASGTNGHPGARLSVQNDGNVVLYDAGKALWSTHTCCL